MTHPDNVSWLDPARRNDDDDSQTRPAGPPMPGRVARDPSAYYEPDPVHQATSVWVTAMRDAKAQRRGRYVPASIQHPARMLPEIARHAITHYTRPGDLVLDPMCGIGTTLVEAIHAGRDALGVEYESQWVAVARNNLSLARRNGATGTAKVTCDDSRGLPKVVHRLLPAPTPQRPVDLVLTSPPYGEHTHGHARSNPGQGVQKVNHRYSPTRRGSANLAHADLDRLLEGFAQILTGAVQLLRPGGHVVLTARPYRRGGELVDLPSAVIAVAESTGLTLIERMPALMAGLRDDHLVPRTSFFQLLQAREARTAGTPQQVVVHEDVVVLALKPGRAATRAATGRALAPPAALGHLQARDAA